MNQGFYTALGTPLDDFGNLVIKSFVKHIEDQICAGASGLLVMGSMGIEPCIKESEYSNVARAGAEIVNGRSPLFIGAMDNSVHRIKDRIKALEGLKIDGVVITTPFYFNSNPAEAVEFFKKVASLSNFPVYLYDLFVSTRMEISIETVEALMSIDNIKGIKTSNILMARKIYHSLERKNDFEIFFSGLDIMDVAYKYGFKLNLDGMFGCTVPITKEMYYNLEIDNIDIASKCLNKILSLRDKFIEVGLFNGFSYAMNLLGYEGNFAPDYLCKDDYAEFECIREYMETLDLI